MFAVGSTPRRRSGVPLALGVMPLLLAACVAAPVQRAPGPTVPEPAARWVAVRWSHPHAAEVRSFRVYWGVEPGEYLVAEDVGLPTPQAGVYRARLRVPADETVHVAVTAVGQGGESRFSNLGSCPPGSLRVVPDPEP